MFKRFARALLCLVCVAAAASAPRAQAAGEEKPRSLLDNRVTFTLPAEWAAKRHASTKTQGNVQLEVPTLNAKAAAPVASLAAYAVGAEVNVRTLSDGVYKNRYQGLTILSDAFDGEEWRTVVWTAKSATPYLAVHRFGVARGVAVELSVVFHLPENGDVKAAEKRVAEFNAMCESLKIDGRNRFTNRVGLEGFAEKLKAVK